MKGILTEIKRFAVHDGDGIRTTVFLKGCPLRCVWCHNPEGLSGKAQLGYFAHKCVGCGQCATVCARHSVIDGVHRFDREGCTVCGKCSEKCFTEALKRYGTETTVEELLPVLLEDRDFFANSGGGVTLSGGECLVQGDFCAELLQALKEEAIHTAVDTCGFVPRSTFDKVVPFTDIFLYDLKAADPEVHKKCTGQENGLILDNLRYLDQCGKDIEVRIPFVPGWNTQEIAGIAEILAGLSHLTKVRVLPYHNFAGSKYDALALENTLPEILPESEAVEAARELIRARCGCKVM